MSSNALLNSESYDEWLASFKPSKDDIESIRMAEIRKEQAVTAFDKQARELYRKAKEHGGVLNWVKRARTQFLVNPNRMKVLRYMLDHFEKVQEYEMCAEFKKAIDYLDE